MHKKISWVVDARIKEGALDAFRVLLSEMVALVEEAEPGTRVYEWYLTDDGTRCHIVERYEDNAAAEAHLEWFQQHAVARFLELADLEGLTVYGDVSDKVRAVAGGFGATFMAPIGGFAR